MIVVVHLSHGTLAKSTISVDGSAPQFISFASGDEALVVEAYNQAKYIDQTNCEWLIEASKSASTIELVLKHPIIATNCSFEKGLYIRHDSVLYPSFRAIVDSVLTLIP